MLHDIDLYIYKIPYIFKSFNAISYWFCFLHPVSMCLRCRLMPFHHTFQLTHYVHECLNKVSINMCDNEESHTIQKTIADRFSASKIMSDGRSMSTRIPLYCRMHNNVKYLSQIIFNVATCAEFVENNCTKKMLIWTFVYDIRFIFFSFVSFSLILRLMFSFTVFPSQFSFTHMRKTTEKKHHNHPRIRLYKKK